MTNAVIPAKAGIHLPFRWIPAFAGMTILAIGSSWHSSPSKYIVANPKSKIDMLIHDVFGDLPIIETERLVLRRLRAGDAEAVFAYASDPEVSKQVVWDTHRSIRDSRTFIDINLELYAAGEVATWGLELKKIGLLIGTCGFVFWNTVHARAEVGYALARQYWGRGIMTEATRAMIDFGFTTMRLNRIEARCEMENTGSSRVMEKSGMTFEGVLREQMFVKGTFRDLKMYSILRREWESGGK